MAEKTGFGAQKVYLGQRSTLGILLFVCALVSPLHFLFAFFAFTKVATSNTTLVLVAVILGFVAVAVVL